MSNSNWEHDDIVGKCFSLRDFHISYYRLFADKESLFTLQFPDYDVKVMLFVQEPAVTELIISIFKH